MPLAELRVVGMNIGTGIGNGIGTGTGNGCAYIAAGVGRYIGTGIGMTIFRSRKLSVWQPTVNCIGRAWTSLLLLEGAHIVAALAIRFGNGGTVTI